MSLIEIDTGGGLPIDIDLSAIYGSRITNQLGRVALYNILSVNKYLFAFLLKNSVKHHANVM